jgi:hypothetical protein
LADQAEVSVDLEIGAVRERDAAADVEQLEVSADGDAGPAAAQVDPIEHVERLHVAAGRDGCTGQDGVECDPVDGRIPGDLQGAGQLGILEAFDRPDRAAVDRNLADVQQVVPAGFAIREALGEALHLGLSEGIDGQIGIRGRAVDDDPHATARHGVSPDRPDRLRIVRSLLGDE